MLDTQMSSLISKPHQILQVYQACLNYYKNKKIKKHHNWRHMTTLTLRIIVLRSISFSIDFYLLMIFMFYLDSLVSSSDHVQNSKTSLKKKKAKNKPANQPINQQKKTKPPYFIKAAATEMCEQIIQMQTAADTSTYCSGKLAVGYK